MKNKKNTFPLQTLFIFFLIDSLLFAQPGSTDDTGTLEGTEAPAAPIDSWLGLLLVLGLFLGYYILKNRKQISE